jgi:hypothetical protein
VSWPEPSALPCLLAHLSTYGELYPTEMGRSAQAWLPLLAEAGWLAPLTEETFGATAGYFALPADQSNLDYQRRICFKLPAYRHYLMAVLAQGLVQAGQVDYHQNLNDWLTGPLVGVVSEINALLDELESGTKGRMVEWPAEQVNRCFNHWHAGHKPFTTWDKAWLGLSGSPEQLFTAVLSHAEAFANNKGDETEARPFSYQAAPPAILPGFELPKDESGRLAAPAFTPWTTERRLFNSSLPAYSAHGQPQYDSSQSIPVVWQDLLVQQPYYRAILRTAVAVHFSAYSGDDLTLFVPDELARTRLQADQRERGTLIELLPHLVAVLGYRPLTPIGPAQVEQVLYHWLTVGVLELEAGQLHLQETYARTLHERRRAKMLLRGEAREEQECIEKYLKSGQNRSWDRAQISLTSGG